MDQLSEQPLFELQVDDIAKAHLMESAKWSKFLAIISFIGSGLMFIVAFFAGSVMDRYNSPYDTTGLAALGGAVVTVVYIIFAIVFLIPNIFRYKYAVKSIRAIRTNDSYTLNDSFNNLRLMNKFWGILAIIIIGLYLLVFLFGIAGAVMR